MKLLRPMLPPRAELRFHATPGIGTTTRKPLSQRELGEAIHALLRGGSR